MVRPALLIWMLAWTVFSGALIVVALLIPSAQPRLGLWILGAVVAAGALATPLSLRVGKAMTE